MGEREQSSLAGSEISEIEQNPVGIGCSLTKEGGAPDNKLITMSANIMVGEEDCWAAPVLNRELTGSQGYKLRQPLIMYEPVHPKLAGEDSQVERRGTVNLSQQVTPKEVEGCETPFWCNT